MNTDSVVTLCEGDLTVDPDSAGPPSVRVCPGGPWLVRGAAAVVDEDGGLHPTVRPVVAVCACGKSQRAPWCDGTHKLIPSPAPR